MPTKFQLGDETLEIPKFKLREIRAAAPFIDVAISNRRKTMLIAGDGATPVEIASRLEKRGGAMTWLIESLGDIVRVIAVGCLHAKGERPYSGVSIEAMAQIIEGEVDMDNLGSLNVAFDEICREAGMLRELPQKAPVEETGAEIDLSQSEQSELSPSLSPPDAAAETGNE